MFWVETSLVPWFLIALSCAEVIGIIPSPNAVWSCCSGGGARAGPSRSIFPYKVPFFQDPFQCAIAIILLLGSPEGGPDFVRGDLRLPRAVPSVAEDSGWPGVLETKEGGFLKSPCFCCLRRFVVRMLSVIR